MGRRELFAVRAVPVLQAAGSEVGEPADRGVFLLDWLCRPGRHDGTGHRNRDQGTVRRKILYTGYVVEIAVHERLQGTGIPETDLRQRRQQEGRRRKKRRQERRGW